MPVFQFRALDQAGRPLGCPRCGEPTLRIHAEFKGRTHEEPRMIRCGRRKCGWLRVLVDYP